MSAAIRGPTHHHTSIIWTTVSLCSFNFLVRSSPPLSLFIDHFWYWDRWRSVVHLFLFSCFHQQHKGFRLVSRHIEPPLYRQLPRSPLVTAFLYFKPRTTFSTLIPLPAEESIRNSAPIKTALVFFYCPSLPRRYSRDLSCLPRRRLALAFVVL